VRELGGCVCVCTFVRVTEGTMCTICPYIMFCSPYGVQCHAVVNLGMVDVIVIPEVGFTFHVSYHTAKNERANWD